MHLAMTTTTLCSCVGKRKTETLQISLRYETEGFSDSNEVEMYKVVNKRPFCVMF